MQRDAACPGDEMGPGFELGELLPHRQLAALDDVLGVVPVVHERIDIGRERFLVLIEELQVVLRRLIWTGFRHF